MADGFYSNDDDYGLGCFGGYGSDGAWAYAEDAGGTDPAGQPGFGSVLDSGAFATTARRRNRFADMFRADGSGGYGRAADASAFANDVSKVEYPIRPA